jgi:transcription initiation factor TFIIIB Brf1 subunit/transcription initiation factor TFIIB
MTQERCPECGSTNVEHEVETCPDQHVVIAYYWVCGDCGEGWGYPEDLERRASE